MDKVTYKGLTFIPYIDAASITKRVEEIAESINKDCSEDTPLFLCVLTGAFPFASDIFRRIKGDAEIAFIRLQSYSGTGSTGNVKQIMGLNENITGRKVIIIEDIIDTGRTISNLVKDLSAKQPKEIKIATLLFKPEALQIPVKPDYIGFEIPSKFIVGYGLDLDGLGRNLPDIWVLQPEDNPEDNK